MGSLLAVGGFIDTTDTNRGVEMKSRFWKRGTAPNVMARAIVAVVAIAFAAFATPNRAFGDPGDELLATGISYHQNGNYNNAIPTLESFVSQYPTSKARNKGELYLGAAYLARNASPSDVTTARQHFNYILAQGKNASYYRDASFHNARSFYNAQDYANARTLLLQFLSDFPQDSFNQYVYYYLGVCETNVGSLDQAIAYYDRSEAEFPNSPLKWFCKLEKATLLGRKGQYAQSEQLLLAIAGDSTAPANIVGQATIQRALLRIVQGDANGAISMLEDYIQRYKNDPSLVATIQDAYLYEAYALFSQKEYQRALNLIDEIERIGTTLPPEAAIVKIKLLLALGQFDAAESLLNRLQNSAYGQATPDIITSHQAMIDARRGNRDKVITNLDAMLQPRATSSTSNYVEFQYFNSPRNYLDPINFVEACGVLTVAYAGRYGANKNPSDYAAQDAIYQATARYAEKVSDPAVSLALKAIDKRRKDVMANPQQGQQPGFSVVSAGGIYNGAPAGGDGFTVPPQNSMGIPTQQLAPQQQLPPQQQPSAAQAPSLGGQNVVPNASAGSLTANQTPPNQGNFASVAPQTNQGLNLSGLAPQTNQNAPNAGVAPFPNAATQQQNQQTLGGSASAQYPQTNGVAPNASGVAQNAGVNPNANVNPNAAYNPNVAGVAAPNNVGYPQQQYYPNAQGVPQTVQAPQEESSPLTPEEARNAIKRATELYTNLDFERANEILLEATTKSETFWTDCPAEAARIALLRANALLELGMRSEAQMVCEDITTHTPNSPEATVAYYYLGTLADEAGRGDDAIDYLSRATSGRGDFPYCDAALYCLGRNEFERGNVNAAAQTFHRVYREYPGSPYWSHAVWNLANIEAERGADQSAEKLVNEALARRPDSAIVDYLLFLKGEIALRAKDYDKALVAFDMIVDQYPDSRWYSRAKNRIAAIPERFLSSVGSAPVEPTPRARSAETDLTSYDAKLPATPPTPRASSYDRRAYDLDEDFEDRRPRSSVNIPSPSELRERAARNLTGANSRSSSPAQSGTSSTPSSGQNSATQSNATGTSGSSARTPIPSSSSSSATRSSSSATPK